MVVDIISSSDKIADTEKPNTKIEDIKRLKNTFKDKVLDFMSAYKRLRVDAKKVESKVDLDGKLEKISDEIEKLLCAGIGYTKTYIKHHKKEKNLTVTFSVVYAVGVTLLLLFGTWLFAFASLFIILKGGIFVASFFGLSYLFYDAMYMFSRKYCFDSMAKTKTNGLGAIDSINRESESILDELDMTFVATGKFIKTLNELSDAADALYDTEV